MLPHGTLFNHSTTALEFQRTLFKRHAVDHVLNLADYQFFLFDEARPSSDRDRLPEASRRRTGSISSNIGHLKPIGWSRVLRSSLFRRKIAAQ